MTIKQLSALFLCNLIPLIVGNARVALFPLYIKRFAADETTTGIVLALQFTALALGTIVGGWYSDTYQKRKEALIFGGFVSVPAIILMGLVDNLILLTLLVIVVGFVNGTVILMVNTLTGLFADPKLRGQSFGIIGSTLALGALIGGAIAGPIVDRWDFPTLFFITGTLTILLPISAFFLQDKVVEQAEGATNSGSIRLIGGAFLLLFIASNLTYVTPYIGSLGRPLLMDDLGFSSTAVSSTVAVSGAVSLSLTWLAGWLSDKLKRTHLMIVCYVANTFGMILLALASQLWQFQFSAALLLGVNVSLAVGSALVTDMATPENLGRSLSLFNATPWIGGVIGYAATGIAIQQFGISTTFWIGAIFPIIAIILVLYAFYAPSSSP